MQSLSSANAIHGISYTHQSSHDTVRVKPATAVLWDYSTISGWISDPSAMWTADLHATTTWPNSPPPPLTGPPMPRRQPVWNPEHTPPPPPHIIQQLPYYPSPPPPPPECMMMNHNTSAPRMIDPLGAVLSPEPRSGDFTPPPPINNVVFTDHHHDHHPDSCSRDDDKLVESLFGTDDYSTKELILSGLNGLGLGCSEPDLMTGLWGVATSSSAPESLFSAAGDRRHLWEHETE
jgi:hypothetical protein